MPTVYLYDNASLGQQTHKWKSLPVDLLAELGWTRVEHITKESDVIIANQLTSELILFLRKLRKKCWIAEARSTAGELRGAWHHIQSSYVHGFLLPWVFQKVSAYTDTTHYSPIAKHVHPTAAIDKSRHDTLSKPLFVFPWNIDRFAHISCACSPKPTLTPSSSDRNTLLVVNASTSLVNSLRSSVDNDSSNEWVIDTQPAFKHPTDTTLAVIWDLTTTNEKSCFEPVEDILIALRSGALVVIFGIATMSWKTVPAWMEYITRTVQHTTSADSIVPWLLQRHDTATSMVPWSHATLVAECATTLHACLDFQNKK